MTTLDYPTDHTIKSYPLAFHQIYSQLGWKQLYYGCLSKEWKHFIGQNHPDLDAIKFYVKITQLVWTHMLELWTACNQDNTKATKQFPQNMMSEINGIFALQDWLPPHTQGQIFHLTKEELMTKLKH